MLHDLWMSVAEHHARAPRSVRCFVLTVSDSRTSETDEAGHLLQAALVDAGHKVVGYELRRDEPEEIASLVSRIVRDRAADAILVNGGTGIARRDSTYEAIATLLDKRLDGFGELFRMLSYQEIGPAAMLSRALAGVKGGVAIFALPGSPAAVRLAVDRLLLPELGHIVGELQR